MKYIKTFEDIKSVKKGDIVIWIEGISNIDTRGKGWSAAPISRDVKYGDKCEVTNVKKIKGKIQIKLKNLRNNKYINKLFDTAGRSSVYSKFGNWLPIYYVSKLENIKDDNIKYKKYIILNIKTLYENTHLIVEIINKKFEQYTVNIIDDGTELKYDDYFTISSSEIKKSFVYDSDSLIDVKEHLELLLNSNKYNL